MSLRREGPREIAQSSQMATPPGTISQQGQILRQANHPPYKMPLDLRIPLRSAPKGGEGSSTSTSSNTVPQEMTAPARMISQQGQIIRPDNHPPYEMPLDLRIPLHFTPKDRHRWNSYVDVDDPVYQTAKEVAQDAREGLRSANFPIMLRLSELTEDGTKFWAVTVDREDADGCVTFHEPIRQLIIDNFKELNIFQDPPIRWFYNSFQFF